MTYDALNRPLTRLADDLSAYTWDASGMRTANNPYAHISRTYYPNGAVKTDSIAYSVSDTSLHDFSQKYGLAYTYDLAGNVLSLAHPAALGPVSSAQTTYSYRVVSSSVDTLVVTDPFGNKFAHEFDAAGRVRHLRNIAGSANEILDTRTYNADDLLWSRVVDGAAAHNIRNDLMTYDMRGKMLSDGHRTWTYSPLGPVLNSPSTDELFTFDAQANITGKYANNHDRRHVYLPGTGRIDRSFDVNQDYGDTTKYWYTGGGLVGDKESWRYIGPVSLDENRYETRSELLSYSYDNRLMKVFVQTDTNPRTYEGFYPYRFEESYRYDALGRRLETRLWRTSNCSTKDPDSGCLNTLTRTIWDANQVLYELRWVYPDTNVANWSTGSGVPASGDFGGVIGYTNGTTLDQPLSLFKGDYVVLPHYDAVGHADQGTCPVAFCAAGEPYFAGRYAKTFGGIDPAAAKWYGTLINGMTDGSKYLYRRNRYFDPSTGRFTQEDPIGLAGGMNLYGFAGGDPVNFSDPLGLFGWPSWREIGRTVVRLAEVLGHYFLSGGGIGGGGGPSIPDELDPKNNPPGQHAPAPSFAPPESVTVKPPHDSPMDRFWERNRLGIEMIRRYFPAPVETRPTVPPPGFLPGPGGFPIFVPMD